MEKELRPTITTYEIRCALGTEVARGKMTKEEKERIETLLGLQWREEEYQKKDEAHFFEELAQFFKKWDLLLNIDGMSIIGRIEYIVGAWGNDNVYHPRGMNCIGQKEIDLLPRIYQRRKMFQKIKLNPTVKVEDVRPITDAIVRCEVGSWNYVTDDEYKTMLEDLKTKYNL